jgi:hypothetical protein
MAGAVSAAAAGGSMTPAELDLIVAPIERRWGIGRLPLLVPADLAAKFDKMAGMYRDGGHTPQLVAGMARAWQALDAAATAAGAAEAASLTWEAAPPQIGMPEDLDRPWYLLGDSIAIVASEAHGKRVRATADVLRVDVDIWPAVEVVHCAITRSPEAMTAILGSAAVVARRVMDAFPGATMTVRPRAGRLPVDEVPFGQEEHAA